MGRISSYLGSPEFISWRGNRLSWTSPVFSHSLTENPVTLPEVLGQQAYHKCRVSTSSAGTVTHTAGQYLKSECSRVLPHSFQWFFFSLALVPSSKIRDITVFLIRTNHPYLYKALGLWVKSQSGRMKGKSSDSHTCAVGHCEAVLTVHSFVLFILYRSTTYVKLDQWAE